MSMCRRDNEPTFFFTPNPWLVLGLGPRLGYKGPGLGLKDRGYG